MLSQFFKKGGKINVLRKLWKTKLKRREVNIPYDLSQWGLLLHSLLFFPFCLEKSYCKWEILLRLTEYGSKLFYNTWRIKGLKDYGVWNLLWDVSSIITVAMIRKIDKYGQNINDCCLWVKVIWEQDFQNILNLIVLLNLDF